MSYVTTMKKYCSDNFNRTWEYIHADAIYFAYTHSPDVKLMLVTAQGNSNGLGNRGRVYRADGSAYNRSGMCLIDPIYCYGTSLSVIHIGGE